MLHPVIQIKEMLYNHLCDVILMRTTRYRLAAGLLLYVRWIDNLLVPGAVIFMTQVRAYLPVILLQLWFAGYANQRDDGFTSADTSWLDNVA